MRIFMLNNESVYAVPVIHYTMELAMHVKLAIEAIQPDCIAVELPESLQEQSLHAASRLPDISVISADSLYYMCEPCDAAFEGLRSALEKEISAYCIDLDIENYPLFRDPLPDPYSIVHIGLKNYYEAYQLSLKEDRKHLLDQQRELHMARRLKELSFHHEKILFIGGFYHISAVLELMSKNNFPTFDHVQRDSIQVCTLTEDSCRDCLAEYGWISSAYELWREKTSMGFLDRQKLLYFLYKEAAEKYRMNTGNNFPGYHFRNIMKFAHNYALIHNRLMPNLFEILSAAKGCVDHNYAYEVWYLATQYTFRKNIDNLEERNLSIEEVWGRSKLLKFHLKQKQRKGLDFQRRNKDRSKIRYHPPSPFSICSYPPEDVVVETFGDFLKKKGNILLSEEGARTQPFTTSLEDGVDTRETIRHFYERKLYVKVRGRPPGAVGSVVVIFEEDIPETCEERYPWRTTWIGEHSQESDMAFYASGITENVVGPGISRCEYGGFMMSYPPRRLYDIWNDPDYFQCRSKAETLLMAAIDYAQKPMIVYVAEKPPRSKMKSFAKSFGKKIVYIPIGQLSPMMLNKIRVFHVLDGYDKREIAGEYIF